MAGNNRVVGLLEDIRTCLEAEEPSSDSIDASEKLAYAVAVAGTEMGLDAAQIFDAIKGLAKDKSKFMKYLKVGSRSGVAKSTVMALKKGL